ncbi:MAG: glycoside hydrolase domain-containing protein [Acidobacteriota bacterium]
MLAFQLLVEADANGIKTLSAGLPELRQAGGGAKISYAPPAADPTYYLGRDIQVFSVHYMNVTRPTAATWIYFGDKPSAPKDPEGLKPVQLVPENARPGKGGMPLTVPASRVQAIWFEIYTARDLPAGRYAGKVTVQADSIKQEIPIELELFDFTLPDQNSMHAMVYYERDQFDLYHGQDLDSAYHRFAHRNRIELVRAYNETAVKEHAGRLSGADFTGKTGYAGPGENVGNTIVPLTFYGPGRDFDQPETAWRRADSWMTFLKSTLPGAITFVYMPDEPNRSQFPRIKQLAENIHSNPGPGKSLPVLVTHQYTPELDGAIDIWCSGPQGYFIQKAAEEKRKGHEYWIYNGGRPYGGAIVIDAPATDARATIWGCFKHGIPVYFYWHGNHWRHNFQKPGNRIQNVWVEPVTFDNRGQPNKPIDDQSFANGDGVLFYPGQEKLHPEQDRGIPGPCSTVQLANFRRGLQDHQYLTMARKLGLNDLVDEVINSTVPRMFSDVKKNDPVGFSEEGDDYEKARRRLAEAIVQKQRER